MKFSTVKLHLQNKFANLNSKIHVKTQIFFKNRIPKKANKFGDMWVIKSNNIAAETVSAVNNISAANVVNTANTVNTVNTVNAAKDKTAPITSTKYSSHKIPNSIDPQSSKLSKFEYVDINGQPKTTEAWVPLRN